MTIPVHLGGTPDISWTFGRDFRPLPDTREGLTTTPGHPGGTPDGPRTFGRA